MVASWSSHAYTPMEVDSENPILNLNSQSDSSSREEMEGAVQQDSATAEMGNGCAGSRSITKK